MAVVANLAVAFDKAMLTACPHLGGVFCPGLILDRCYSYVVAKTFLPSYVSPTIRSKTADERCRGMMRL